MTDTSLTPADSLMLHTFNKMMEDEEERKAIIKEWVDFEVEHWSDPVYPEIYLPQLEHQYQSEDYVLDRVIDFVTNRERSLVVTKEDFHPNANVTSKDIDGYVERAFKILRDHETISWEARDRFPSYKIEVR